MSAGRFRRPDVHQPVYQPLGPLAPHARTETMMSSADNKKLVQQIYADSANRSGTTFVDNVAEDVTWVVTGQYSWSHEFQGRDAIQNGLMCHLRSLLAAWRPRTLAVKFIAVHEYVVV